MLPLGDMVTSGSALVLGTMPGPMALQHPGSVLMSMASVTTEVCEDDWSLGKYLSPCWFPGAMLLLESC